jgi:hypothetical protein
MAQELETKTCPDCGRPSLPEKEACWRCGADLSQVTPEAIPLDVLPARRSVPEGDQGAPGRPAPERRWVWGRR